jgi:hypothetical protein
MTKAAFNKKLDLNLRKRLFMCYIWTRACMVLKLGRFKKWIINTWKVVNYGAEEGYWTETVKNELVRRVKDERNILYKTRKRRLPGLVTSYVGNDLINT